MLYNQIMIENLFIFSVSIFLIIKGATLSTKYAFQASQKLNISKYVVGFIIVAIISIIPETLVSINSAIAGVPSMGLGTLLGSNVADLTLVFTIIVLFAGRSIKVESKILKENSIYPFFLLIPIMLGLDGFYSRTEGIVLIIMGLIFYYLAFKKNKEEKTTDKTPSNIGIENKSKGKDILFLVFSLAMLLVGSHFVVFSGVNIANYMGVNSAVVGMLVIGLGTTMPELFFCLSAIKKKHDSLAIGDILGTVLADATVVIGILALIDPFVFPKKIIYIAGLFMVFSSFLLFYFMKTGKSLSKKEAILLASFWILFVLTELIING